MLPLPTPITAIKTSPLLVARRRRPVDKCRSARTARIISQCAIKHVEHVSLGRASRPKTIRGDRQTLPLGPRLPPLLESRRPRRSAVKGQ